MLGKLRPLDHLHLVSSLWFFFSIYILRIIRHRKKLVSFLLKFYLYSSLKIILKLHETGMCPLWLIWKKTLLWHVFTTLRGWKHCIVGTRRWHTRKCLASLAHDRSCCTSMMYTSHSSIADAAGDFPCVLLGLKRL